MKKVLFLILLLPLLTLGQTQPLGAVIGNQTVINAPVYPPGYAMAQALIYYPDDYFLPKNANKRYPLYVFLHGAGEGKGSDITIVTNTSLPYLIKKGLKPYGIDPETGDTVKWIIVSPFCANCGGSYSFPQLQYTLPYLKTNYRVDTSCIWFGGLSSGGSCTWSMAMGNGVSPSPKDTLMTLGIAGIMPMANGGYDNNFGVTQLRANLDTTAKRGLAVLTIIGDADPGYNDIGFRAYQAEMKKYCQPRRYFDSVRKNTAHTDSVWNIPFPLNARVWSKAINSWTQMWAMRKRTSIVPSPPPVNPLHARIWVDSLTIHYPNVAVHLVDSSAGKHNHTSWGATAYPAGFPGLFWGGITFGDMLLTNLVEGSYKVQLVIGDDQDNTDTAVVNIRVYGPPACPAPIICPAPRKVVSIQVQLFGVMVPIPVDAAKISYDDGNP